MGDGTDGIGAIGWMRSVVIDAHDPGTVAASGAACWTSRSSRRSPTGCSSARTRAARSWRSSPPAAPRPSALVARPDIEVEDIDVARDRVLEIGGTYVRTISELKGDHHYVMADPEGNEFCLVQPLPPELARPRWGDRAV